MPAWFEKWRQSRDSPNPPPPLVTDCEFAIPHPDHQYQRHHHHHHHHNALNIETEDFRIWNLEELSKVPKAAQVNRDELSEKGPLTHLLACSKSPVVRTQV